MTADTAALDAPLIEVFDRHSTDDWAAIDVQVVRYAADRCVICGGPGGPECTKCAIEFDAQIKRRTDV